MDEYRKNKELLQHERDTLKEMLAQHKPEDTYEQNKMQILKNIKSAYDIISASNSSHQQKHEALASVVDKIVYNKKNEAISIHFYINN